MIHTDFDPNIEEDFPDQEDNSCPFNTNLYQQQPANFLLPAPGKIQSSPYQLKHLKQVKKCLTIGSSQQYSSGLQQNQDQFNNGTANQAASKNNQNLVLQQQISSKPVDSRKPLGSLPSQSARRSLAPPSTTTITSTLTEGVAKNNHPSERRCTLLKSDMCYQPGALLSSQQQMQQFTQNATGALTQRSNVSNSAKKSIQFMNFGNRDTDDYQLPASLVSSQQNNVASSNFGLQKQPLQRRTSIKYTNNKIENQSLQSELNNQNSCHQLLHSMQQISPLKVCKNIDNNTNVAQPIAKGMIQELSSSSQQLKQSIQSNFCLIPSQINQMNSGALNELTERSEGFESDSQNSTVDEGKYQQENLFDDCQSLGSDSLPMMQSPKVQVIINNNSLRQNNESRQHYNSNVTKQQKTKTKKSQLFISSLDMGSGLQNPSNKAQQYVLPSSKRTEQPNANLLSTGQYSNISNNINQQDDILKETCGSSLFSNSGLLNTNSGQNIAINTNLLHIIPRNKELLQSLQQPAVRQESQPNYSGKVVSKKQLLPAVVNQPLASQRHAHVNSSIQGQQLQVLKRSSKEEKNDSKSMKFDPPQEFNSAQNDVSNYGSMYFKSLQKQQQLQQAQESQRQRQNHQLRSNSLIPIIITHGEWQGSKDSLIQPWSKNQTSTAKKQQKPSSQQSSPSAAAHPNKGSYGIDYTSQAAGNAPNQVNQVNQQKQQNVNSNALPRKLSIVQKQQQRAMLNDTMSNGFKEVIVQSQAQNQMSQQSTGGTNQSKVDTKNSTNQTNSSSSSRRSKSSLNCSREEEASTDSNSYQKSTHLVQTSQPKTPSKQQSKQLISDYLPINAAEHVSQREEQNLLEKNPSLKNLKDGSNKTKRNLRLQSFRVHKNPTSTSDDYAEDASNSSSNVVETTQSKQQENCYSETTTDRRRSRRLSSQERQQQSQSFALPTINQKRKNQQPLIVMAASDLRM